MSRQPLEIFVALVHHPVVNRQGEVITSAITNLDIHDIARTAATYGVRGFFVVTPLEGQKALVERVMAHWKSGLGGALNPDRKEAFSLVEPCTTVEEAVKAASERCRGCKITLVGTSARRLEGCLAWRKFEKKVCKREVECILLLFGTASGLHDSCLSSCDHVLCPIEAGTGYNHLSVRSAVAIVLDRISQFSGGVSTWTP